MGTRVTTTSSGGWFVRESVDEIKERVAARTVPFVDLTPIRKTARGPITIAVIHLVALEPYDD